MPLGSPSLEEYLSSREERKKESSFAYAQRAEGEVVQKQP